MSNINDFYEKFDGIQVEEFVNSWYGQANYPIVDIKLEYLANIQKMLIKFEQSRFLLNNFQNNNSNNQADNEDNDDQKEDKYLSFIFYCLFLISRNKGFYVKN
jgi:hypothetical protein